jgi:flagellar biosynthetic protein FliR
MIAAMHMAGSIISYQSSLASALTPGITQFQGQDTSLNNFLSLSAVVLLFATNLHHLMLQGLADSYTLFVPGHFPSVGDFAQHAAHTLSGAFAMAMKLAAPSIVIGTTLYLGAGIIARLMPNIQIFFIMLPANLLLSFIILMITISSILMWYMDYFRSSLLVFLHP